MLIQLLQVLKNYRPTSMKDFAPITHSNVNNDYRDQQPNALNLGLPRPTVFLCGNENRKSGLILVCGHYFTV